MKFPRSPVVWLAGVLLLAAAWKLLFIFWNVLPFNADEAVVALMAKHILAGERPAFFYGQAYMGSLDAYLVAFGFWLFGEQVLIIRLVQVALYLAVLVTVYAIGCVAFDSPRAGLTAAALLAIPTVNTTLYTTATLGGYNEALLIGSLALLVVFWIARFGLPGQRKAAWVAMLAYGLLTGFGLWANGLSLVFTIPAGFYLAWAVWKQRGLRALAALVGLAAAGVLVGALPWWIYALEHGPNQLLQELLGTAVAVEKDHWLLRTYSHMLNFVLLGTTVIFGFRPPWAVAWLVLPLLPFVLMFWCVVILFFIRRMRAGNPYRAEIGMLAGVGVVLLAGFLFTPFGVDPSGRYFLPLAIPLALAAALMLGSIVMKPWLPWALLALVIGYQAWGTLQCALRDPPGITTQFYEPTIVDHRYQSQLADFLLSEGELHGYSNYWVSYPLAFLSGEELIFIPRLPYHLDLRYTPRDDRYAPYGEQVADNERVAFITTRNPALDDHLRQRFDQLSVTWLEKAIGDYTVYYRLSQPVRPEQLGFGGQQP